MNTKYYLTKNTVLTKNSMLYVVGWKYVGKSRLFNSRINEMAKYVAVNHNGERVSIGDTMKEAEEFCLNKYKEFYNSHPEEHDRLPDPYNRRKTVSKIVIVQS